MSQYPAQPMMLPRETNPLGIAGFVCSVIGLLFTGGLLCPIGVILSLIALGRRPKGFAIAGLVIGLLGLCGWVIAFLMFGAAILAMIGLAAALVILTESEKLEITTDMANMAVAIKAYENDNTYLPADLSELNLKTPLLTDPWGNRYEYHLTDEKPGFEIECSGEDGRFGTEDDVQFTNLGKTWQAGGFGVDVNEDPSSGTVRITLGGHSVTATGDDDGGRVTIDLGDRTIEIVGDDQGGAVNFGSPGAATTPKTPDAPPDAPPDDGAAAPSTAPGGG